MRLIDADELMEHVYRDKLDSRELIADMVNNAPTIEPPHWIPCSERLPEKDGIYIVCFDKGHLMEDEIQVETAYWLNGE